LNNLWDSGLLAGIWNLIWLFFQGKKIRENERDLSIGEWAGRRIDKRIADNIVSAVFHGIYAGDIYNLSMKALLPMIWNLECVSGNPLWGFIQMHRISQQHLRPSGSNQDVNVRLWRRQDLELMQTMVDEVDADPNLLMKCSAMKTSTFAFKNGLQQLVDGLASSLRAKENVEIVTGTEIDSFSRTESTENHGEMAINLSSKKVCVSRILSAHLSAVSGINILEFCKHSLAN
jgi:oxygen-dependent protoporphyrinogen oxidase